MEIKFEKPPLFSLYFDTALGAVPYDTPAQELQDGIYMADMYCYCAMLVRRANGSPEAFPLHMRGMAVTEQEMDAAICSSFLSNRENQLNDDLVQDLERGWAHFESRCAATARFGIATPLSQLTKRLNLGRLELLCLFLSAAVQLDLKYEKINVVLQDSIEATVPRYGLAISLFALGDPAFSAETRLQWVDGRVFQLLFAPSEPVSPLRRPMELRNNTFAFLCGQNRVAAELESSARLLFGDGSRPADEPSALLCGQEYVSRLQSIADCQKVDHHPTAVNLVGLPGSGRLFALRHCAHSLRQNLLTIETPAFFSCGLPELEKRARAVASHCLAEGFWPVFLDFDGTEEEARRLLFQCLEKFELPLVFFISDVPCTGELSHPFGLYRLTVRPPSPQTYLQVWKQLAARYPLLNTEESGGDLPPENERISLDALAGKYRMPVGNIGPVLRTAWLDMRLAGEQALTGRMISHAVSIHAQSRLSQHCTKITPVFGLSDLVVTAPVREQILDIINRYKYSHLVNIEWGFNQKFPYGKGVSVLLYGPPGTGKTMCAQVLARELELELFKVDLSLMVSKYIGETEKNLSSVFREAQKSNAILFFDEADSLFSKRTASVETSNDRYANVETSHLLQKMEEFDGLSILATNLAANFDKAFFRRIQFVVNIGMPDEATRALLWKKSFPGDCPLDSDVDFEYLGNQFELSPSNIKTVALSAAYYAAAQNSNTVRMGHILYALKNDSMKQGRAIDQRLLAGFAL